MNLEELRQCYLDEEVPSIEDIYECDFYQCFRSIF